MTMVERTIFSMTRWLGSKLRYAFFGSLAVLAINQRLFAQEFGAPEEPKSYIPVYIIMIACLGLSLLVMCRAGKRTADFHQE